MKQAVFLDRDGVITEDPPHYAHKPEQLKLIPGAADAIRSLNGMGVAVIVITNQSGVARGYYTEEDVTIYNQALERELEKKNAYVDAIYYCPHHPEFGETKYKIDCNCRKPNTGLLQIAAKEHCIDLEKSFVIGDKLSDIESGKGVGCKTVLVLTGHGGKELENADGGFDISLPSIKEAVSWIINQLKVAR